MGLDGASGVGGVRSQEGLQTMNEPIGNNSTDTTGNVAIPDWMLKRRARQAAAEARQVPEAATSLSTSDPAVISLDVAHEQSEIDTVKTVAPPRPRPKRVSPPVNLALITEALDEDVAEAEAINITPSPHAEKPSAWKTFLASKWVEEFRQQWLSKAALHGYTVSFVTHLTIGLALSLVVFHSELRKLGVDTLMMGDGNDLTAGSLDGTSMFQVEPPGGQAAAEKVESLEAMLSASAISDALGPSELAVSGAVGGKGLAGTGGQGEGEGEGIGDGVSVGGYQMPAGGRAVKKGSFIAWTVPTDPAPGEDYKIIIQVKYAKPSQKISKGDVTGSVIGTDKYRLMFSSKTSDKNSEVIVEANQIVIYVPGASARVRDTIRVYSAILKENQQLEIVF